MTSALRKMLTVVQSIHPYNNPALLREVEVDLPTQSLRNLGAAFELLIPIYSLARCLDTVAGSNNVRTLDMPDMADRSKAAHSSYDVLQHPIQYQARCLQGILLCVRDLADGFGSDIVIHQSVSNTISVTLRVAYNFRYLHSK